MSKTKKEMDKKQKEREKMGDRRGDADDRPNADSMLASMKAGFDNVSKQIGSNSEENQKEMKDIRESIQNLGCMLRQELATFKEEMSSWFENIKRGMEAQGRDIAEIQAHVVETKEWNANFKEILASSLKQQRKLQEKVTDLEWRSRRNNIRVWGVPEGTEKDSTHEFIECLFREELTQNKNPRAIIVNLLQYQQKEDILKKAWQTKIKIEGKRVTFDHDEASEAT